jgi:hypothetical protein
MGFKDHVDMICKAMAKTLALHQPVDHAITFHQGFDFQYSQIYNYFDIWLKTILAFIKANLDKRMIQQWLLPAAAQIIFVIKKDGRPSRCVTNTALNAAPAVNQYPP